MKQLSITFLLTVLISMVGTKAFAHDIAVANDDGVTIYYRFINNNTELEVVYRHTNYYSYSNEYTGNVVIPESVTYSGQSYSVTGIGQYAFRGCNELTSITIPSSVKSIIRPMLLEGCDNLSSIVVENGNTHYDSRDNCNAIIETESNMLILGCKDTNIPNSVTSIYGGAFWFCRSLSSIIIPHSVTSIGGQAFEGCSSLSSVTIGNSVKSIGDCAFRGCSSLASITIPNSVMSIGDYAFENCGSLASITIGDSVTSIGSSAFRSCNSLVSVTLNCSEVGDWFKQNVHIKEVIFGDEVTSISDNAFQNCDSLASVTIGNNVSYIGQDAFSGTPWHNSQLNGNGLVYVGKVAYKYNGSMPANTSVIIEDGTLGIAPYAFSGYSDMVSISIPNSVKSIGSNAFYNCI